MGVSARDSPNGDQRQTLDDHAGEERTAAEGDKPLSIANQIRMSFRQEYPGLSRIYTLTAYVVIVRTDSRRMMFRYRVHFEPHHWGHVSEWMQVAKRMVVGQFERYTQRIAA
jgi:hypothetical protein